jgi:diguanylate cyclase (GGDEF)-like protein
MGGAAQASAWSSRLDNALVVVGGALGLAAVVAAVFSPGGVDPQLLLGVPVIALMSWFPLVLMRADNGIEIGFDSCVLVFLAVIADPLDALAVWTLGVVAAQLTTMKRPRVKAFNIGLGCLAGGAALLTMLLISPLDVASERALLAVTAGCAVYFLVDYVLSAVSVAMDDGSSVLGALRQPSALLALAAFVAIDSLGYLAGLVVQTLPGWTGLLLAVPLTTILVATRALSRGNENGRRLAALFAAAAEAQTLQSPEAVLEGLRTHSRAVVGHTEVDLRETPPEPGEIGARVAGTESPLWLVAPGRNRARASVAADQQALDALVTVAEEALARMELGKQMAHLARHDALTGLANRALFLDRVEHAVALARRSGRPLAVLFLDLDGFKAVNDRFGHDTGDRMLVDAARRLAECLRDGDSFARLGGDEFAVLIEDVRSAEQVEQVCRRLLASLRPDFQVAGHAMVIGASIGVALSALDDDATSLLRNADMAMYHAKAAGKGGYAFYEASLHADNLRRLELVEQLRRDIVADRLVVHYQPVVDLVTGQVTGLEALVRWQSDDGLIGPGDFIPAAEESGLVGAIGRRVLARVIEDAPALRAAAGRALNVGVNVSAHQLREPGLVEDVRRAGAALGGARLVLEMTEHVVIGDDAMTAATLEALAETGALLAIDDFGVGFSSIGYLQHLPVEVLKIDRSFTQDIDTDDRAAALVEAMILMGGALGLSVVAEGIERPSQIDRLRAGGCLLGQGFHFARPLPLPEVLALLRRGPLPLGKSVAVAAAHS